MATVSTVTVACHYQLVMQSSDCILATRCFNHCSSSSSCFDVTPSVDEMPVLGQKDEKLIKKK